MTAGIMVISSPQVTNDDGTVSAFSNDSSVQFTHGNRTFNKDGFVNESYMEFSISVNNKREPYTYNGAPYYHDKTDLLEVCLNDLVYNT